LSRGFAIASPHADDPPPNRTDWRKPESQIARKPTLNPRFLAKTVISDPLLRRPAQRRGGSSRPTDKGYDSNAVRRKIESKGVVPNIPPKANRRWKNCFSPWLYRHRNAIERMFGRLKDFRRIATRYDRLARNFLAAVCLAATLCYWL